MILYTPIQFRNLELPNRWVMSPMCMYSSTEGMVDDFHLVHYGSRAQGGAGLIIAEATAVVPEGRITHRCAGIWNDEQLDAWRKVTDFIHEHSASKTGIQLAHAGRKASTWNGAQLPAEDGWNTVAPSPVPYAEGERPPHELTAEEIQQLVQDFRLAARRAVEAGFDVIEIHAAHGYLIHEFLSPLSNVRTDEYGGSFENRVRFLLKIVDAVNQELDENHPLFVRISGTEYANGGWDIEESVALSRLLKEHQCDLVDVSSGGNIQGARISLFNGYQVPLAAAVRKEADMASGAVGLIKTAEQAEEILQNGEADLIFIGRELLRNPYLPADSSFTHQQNCAFPKQYERGKPQPAKTGK